MRYRPDMMVERIHDCDGLLRAQRIVHEDDSHHGERVPFDCLGDRVSSHCRRQIFVRKVNCGAFHVFDQQICPGQAVLLLALLEVGEAWVFGDLILRVEIFELALAFVQVPELLLCSRSNKDSLGFEVFLFLFTIFAVDLLSI